MSTPSNLASIAHKIAVEAAAAAAAITPGVWIDISGDLVAAWADPASVAEYRVVGDRVELRGFVQVSGAAQALPSTLFTNFPGVGGAIPAGLQPGVPGGSVSFPGIFWEPAVPFPGVISVSNKVAIDNTVGTGVLTQASAVSLDGISWSTSA